MDEIGTSGTTTVRVRYFAAIASATGRRDDEFDLAAPRLSDLCDAIGRRHGARAGELARLCSVLDGEELVREAGARVGDTVDLLPPFAGG